MHDRVAEVLGQRRALDRDAGAGVAVSLVLHGGLVALAVYAALHAAPPQRASMVNIQFANVPAAAPAPAVAKPVTRQQPAAPKIEEPKPRIEEPKPKVAEPPAKPEKNTVPFSPFGRSTKKGSETPAPATPKPAAPAGPAADSAPAVPVGGAGVTGIEGGDFPHTLYVEAMQRRIGSNYFRPPAAPSGTQVVVYFRILRDGRIVEAKVETSSGIPSFDRAALSALASSSPLNPLPFAYNGTHLGVHLIFK